MKSVGEVSRSFMRGRGCARLRGVKVLLPMNIIPKKDIKVCLKQNCELNLGNSLLRVGPVMIWLDGAFLNEATCLYRWAVYPARNGAITIGTDS
jgi:hypothetical protein